MAYLANLTAKNGQESMVEKKEFKGNKNKICIIDVYLLKYYFKNHLIYKGSYNYNQFNIMVSYVDVIGLCHSVAIL